MPGWFSRTVRSAGEQLDLPGPAGRAAGLAVDLGQHGVRDEVAELLLAAYVPVQRGGDHAEAGGQGAHAQRVHAAVADDGQRLGDDPLAGQRAAVPVIAVGRAEPQRVRAGIGLALPVRHLRLLALSLTVNAVHDTVNSVTRKRMSFTRIAFFPGSPGRWSGETHEGERHDSHDKLGSIR